VRRDVVVAAVLALAVTAAFSVPLIQVTLQQLGAGAVEVVSPVGRVWVNHVLALADSKICVDAVKVRFDADLPAGTRIRVEIRDQGDSVIAAGEATLANPLQAGSWLTIDLQPNLGIQDIAGKYHRLAILVAGPEVQP